MKEHSIIFSGEMVRAIFDGRKSQTRRLVKPQPSPVATQLKPLFKNYWKEYRGAGSMLTPTIDDFVCPYGVPGDRLWVRETWRVSESSTNEYSPSKDDVHFRADEDECSGGSWRSPIHMPRWASRVTLEITNIRVERLQGISEEDAKSEGMQFHDDRGIGHSGWRHDQSFGYVQETAREAFAVLWNSLHGPGAWDFNPWVWAISFRRIEAKEVA